jgi:drug/metabolite transporter, DME family
MNHPRLLIASAALLWSTAGAAIKVTSLGAPAIAGGRAVFAGLVLAILLPESRLWRSKAVWITALAYAITCSLFVFANTLTTAGNAIFIQNTAPVWVLLLSPRLLGERPTKPELLSVPLGLTGCLLFFLEDLGHGRWSGDLCALAAGVSYAILIIRYRKTTSAEGLAATVVGNAIIAVLLLPLAFAGPTPSASDLGVILYLGVIQQALAAVLVIRGLRGVSALEGALLILLEPIMSPIWAFLLVGERLGPIAIAGAALVLLSTVWRTYATRAGANRMATG